MMAAARGCRRGEGGMAMKNSTNQCARLGASWLSAPLCGATALLMIAGGPLPAVAGGDGKKGQIEVVDPGKTLFRKSYNELTAHGRTGYKRSHLKGILHSIPMVASAISIRM